jgi:hypothetical protein
MKTYVVGRSSYADIVLADASVARRHAELVVTRGGRHHLTDCASGAGTWRRRDADGGRMAWEPIRQSLVAPEESLRLGDYTCRLADLLRQIEAEHGSAGGAASGRWRPGLQGGGQDRERLRGRVERDPVTGEIVRKRV